MKREEKCHCESTGVKKKSHWKWEKKIGLASIKSVFLFPLEKVLGRGKEWGKNRRSEGRRGKVRERRFGRFARHLRKMGSGVSEKERGASHSALEAHWSM